jgi:hypothetical protein
MLSKSLFPALLLPLWPTLSPEEGENDSKTKERQPIDTAVRKTKTSVARCSPIFHAAPALPKAKSATVIRPALSSPDGSKPKSARTGIKSLMPAVGDKMPHAPYPNAAPPRSVPGYGSLSSKTEISEQLVTVSDVAESKKKASSPDAQTAPRC